MSGQDLQKLCGQAALFSRDHAAEKVQRSGRKQFETRVMNRHTCARVDDDVLAGCFQPANLGG